MLTHTRRVLAFTLTAGLAVGGGLSIAAPAEATIAFSIIIGDASSNSGPKAAPVAYTCDYGVTAPVSNPDPGMPGEADNPPAFTEGGAPATRSYTHGGVVTKSDNPADTIAALSTGSITAQVTGAGGNFTGFELEHSGTASVSPALGAASACYTGQRTDVQTQFAVTLTQPGWLLVEASGQGTPVSASNPGYYEGQLYVERADPYLDGNYVEYDYLGPYGGLEVGSAKSTQSMQVFLTPGIYRISSRFEVQATTLYNHPTPAPSTFAPSASRSASARFVGRLLPAGAKDGAASSTDKGQRFVQLLERSCAADVVAAKLSKKKLKNASKVVFSVNGKKIKTVKLSKKFPKKGAVNIGPIADAEDATVSAKVFLPGKGAARPTLSQDYLACS